MRIIKKILKGVLLFYIILTTIAYFLQDKLVFHPQILAQDFEYDLLIPFEEINLKTADNETLNGLHLKADNAKGVVLYFHGNSGSLKQWGQVTSYFIDYNYDVFVIDFRGFGKSTGKFDEEAMYIDAQLCYDYLKKSYPEEKIVVYGKSMGTTFATKVAAENTPQQLILEVPFYNLADAGQHRFPLAPTFLMKYKFETNKYIQKVNCPITFFHGTDDWVTPYEGSKRLFSEAPIENKQFITIDGGGHNNLINFPKYQNELKELLD